MLRAIKFLRLKWPGLSIGRFCQIEKDDVRVKLRRCITVYRAGAVMLEFCRDPLARCLRWEISSEPGLDISLHFVQRDSDTGSMGFLHAFIAAH